MRTHGPGLIFLAFVFAIAAIAAPPPHYTKGWQPDPGGKVDKAFINHPLFSATKIAAKSDIRSTVSAPPDQGALGSCVANAIEACLAVSHRQSTGEALPEYSRLWLYYWGRKAIGTENQDSGCNLRDVIQAVKDRGAAPEKLWTYNVTRFKGPPPSKAAPAALKAQLLTAYKIQSLDDIRRALSMGRPVAFGVPVFPAIETLNWNNYTLPLPKPGERSIGGHAMTIVGHDDTRQVLIIRNSWGLKWGRGGYFLMPYAYWLKYEKQADAWTAEKME